MKPIPAITLTISLRSLGDIPFHHGDGHEDHDPDAPLPLQIAHLGRSRVTAMLRAELISWLSDLGAEPCRVQAELPRRRRIPMPFRNRS